MLLEAADNGSKTLHSSAVELEFGPSYRFVFKSRRVVSPAALQDLVRESSCVSRRSGGQDRTRPDSERSAVPTEQLEFAKAMMVDLAFDEPHEGRREDERSIVPTQRWRARKRAARDRHVPRVNGGTSQREREDGTTRKSNVC